MAWGIDCGQEIPAVYSNVAGSMCWIDWIMSCLPLSDYNIDQTGDFIGDLRSVFSKSAGGLTREQCEAWLDSQPTLKNKCNLEYEIIDNRSN